MDYYSAVCDREQAQRQQRWVDIEAGRSDQQLEATARQVTQTSVRSSSGKLCTCGMMIAEDCDCHPL
jgi:hypothetical protein